MRKQSQTKFLPAFTLLEVLIYTVMLSIIVSSMTSMILLIYKDKTVIEDRISVNEDMRLLIKSIRDDMYLAEGFVVNSNGSLTIDNPDGSTVTYLLSSAQVYRQVNSTGAVAVTAQSTNVTEFLITDLSSPVAAGTIRIDLALSNYPRGSFKPLISQEVLSTISLKYL